MDQGEEIARLVRRARDAEARTRALELLVVALLRDRFETTPNRDQMLASLTRLTADVRSSRLIDDLYPDGDLSRWVADHLTAMVRSSEP